MKDMLKRWLERDAPVQGTAPGESEGVMVNSIAVPIRCQGRSRAGVGEQVKQFEVTHSAQFSTFGFSSGLKNLTKYEVIPFVLATKGTKNRECGCGKRCRPCTDPRSFPVRFEGTGTLNVECSSMSPEEAQRDAHDATSTTSGWLDSAITRLLLKNDPQFVDADVSMAWKLVSSPEDMGYAASGSTVLRSASIPGLIGVVRRVAGRFALSPSMQYVFSKLGDEITQADASGDPCAEFESMIAMLEAELEERFPHGNDGLRDLHEQCMSDLRGFCRTLLDHDSSCSPPERCHETGDASQDCQRALEMTASERVAYCASLSRATSHGYRSPASQLGRGGASSAYWDALSALADARESLRQCRLAGRTPSRPPGPMGDVSGGDIACAVIAATIAIMLANALVQGIEGGFLQLIGGAIIAAILSLILIQTCPGFRGVFTGRRR